jgi:hypothetical protein
MPRRASLKNAFYVSRCFAMVRGDALTRKPSGFRVARGKSAPSGSKHGRTGCVPALLLVPDFPDVQVRMFCDHSHQRMNRRDRQPKPMDPFPDSNPLLSVMHAGGLCFQLEVPRPRTFFLSAQRSRSGITRRKPKRWIEVRFGIHVLCSPRSLQLLDDGRCDYQRRCPPPPPLPPPLPRGLSCASFTFSARPSMSRPFRL